MKRCLLSIFLLSFLLTACDVGDSKSSIDSDNDEETSDTDQTETPPPVVETPMPTPILGGNVVRYKYDDAGRVIEVIDSKTSFISSYEYDNSGNVSKTTQEKSALD